MCTVGTVDVYRDAMRLEVLLFYLFNRREADVVALAVLDPDGVHVARLQSAVLFINIARLLDNPGVVGLALPPHLTLG